MHSASMYMSFKKSTMSQLYSSCRGKTRLASRHKTLVALLFFGAFALYLWLPQCKPNNNYVNTEQSSSRAQFASETDFPDEFPKLLWQIVTQPNRNESDPKFIPNTESWLKLNPQWKYEMLTGSTMDRFVETHYAERPAVLEFWKELQIPVLKTDLLRYMVMLAQGGVYTDLDTTNFKPIEEWIPQHLRGKTINSIAGIEYADTTYRIFSRPVSFCQWTLMSKPGHAIYEAAIRRVIARLEFLSRRKKKEISQLNLADLAREDVLESTGPGTFSDSLLEVLREQVGSPLTLQNFSHIQEPTLFGDILVLPINAFGWGQKHSNSSKDGWGELYARHHFGHSWYEKKPAKGKRDLHV